MKCVSVDGRGNIHIKLCVDDTEKLNEFRADLRALLRYLQYA